jgi:hypothetical protein
MSRSSTRVLLHVALVATYFFAFFAPQCMAAGRPTLGSSPSATWKGGPKDFSSAARKAWVESTVSNVKTDEAPQLGASGNYFVHSSVRLCFFFSRSISSSSKTRGGVFEWSPL